MPLVVVNYNEHVLQSMEILHKLNFEGIGGKVAEAVAEALSVDDPPDGRLTVHDIEIIFRRQDVDEMPFSEEDNERFRVWSAKSFQVFVWAHDYPARRGNLEERVEKIREVLRAVLPDQIHGFVWVLLAPTAFVTF